MVPQVPKTVFSLLAHCSCWINPIGLFSGSLILFSVIPIQLLSTFSKLSSFTHCIFQFYNFHLVLLKSSFYFFAEIFYFCLFVCVKRSCNYSLKHFYDGCFTVFVTLSQYLIHLGAGVCLLLF